MAMHRTLAFELHDWRDERLDAGALIRSWAILNTGTRPVYVFVFSNNSPRGQDFTIESGEQMIDAACSLTHMRLRSDGTTLEMLISPAAQPQWRFKSVEAVRAPAPPALDDEEFNPLYNRAAVAVRPAPEAVEPPTGVVQVVLAKIKGKK